MLLSLRMLLYVLSYFEKEMVLWALQGLELSSYFMLICREQNLVLPSTDFLVLVREVPIFCH